MIGDYLNHAPTAPLLTRMNNFYHAEEVGPMLVIQINTECYFYTKWGWDLIKWQYEWLEAVLQKANANRHNTPWIAVLGHRPIYCLRLGDADSCNHTNIERPALRNGVHFKGNKNGPLQFGLETLFYEVCYFNDILFQT